MTPDDADPVEPKASGPPYPVYMPKQSRTWWLRTGAYRRFAAREITSMFAAAFSGLMLLFLFALSRGPAHYEGFLRWLKLPGVVAGSAVILAALLYHMATWFRLTSHILVIRLGGRVIARRAVVGGLVAAWLAVSATVAYFHIWF
ncbi:MAG TPA: fumarate reductase subunit C [Actinomycetota bacterium]